MRVLLVINATLDPAREREIADGRYPRKDYLELQHALDAEIVDLGALERYRWTRLVRRLVGRGLAQALLAWVLSRRYDAVFVDQETTGFALAALYRLSRRRPRLTMIGHLLSPPAKQALFRALRLQRAIDCVIVHSSPQQRLARGNLGLRPEQVALVPYQTDERFWSPRDTPLKEQICSIGLEYRDYGTLVEAAKGLNVEVVIRAASHWSTHRGVTANLPLPPNVHLISSQASSLDFTSLRQFYAESLFVVVPLQDTEGPAGITTILEAMAMGKAVVVSHSRGQTDVVRDRRRQSRVEPERQMQPDWARALGAAEGTAQGHTGIYVRPYDPAELRRAIQFLLDHPEQAQEMGRNGRRLVEETMSLDHFTARVAALITGSRAQP